MLSYQASVEFDLNQEAAILTVIGSGGGDPESATLAEESNALDEPLADDDRIVECSREVQEAEQRSQALQNRFDSIEQFILQLASTGISVNCEENKLN